MNPIGNMANPYSAPELTPELAAEERQRPKFVRGLLIDKRLTRGK